MKEFCGGILPCKLVCLSKNRKQAAMETARKALAKEVDIIRLIRSRRFVHLALKHLLDPPLRKEFKARSQAKEINLPKTSSHIDKPIEANNSPDLIDDRTVVISNDFRE